MKGSIIYIIILVLAQSLYSQKWDTIFGNPGTSESFRDVIECYDKGYLISGSYENPQSNWLIKTDINKNILWEKFITWQNTTVYNGYIDQDSNGNIYIASTIYSEINGFWPMAIKLDSCGEKVWCRVFPNYIYDNGWYDDVLALENGDILALARFISTENNDRVYLDYIDSEGNLIWRQLYASQENHPHIRSCSGDGIQKYGDNYIIHGDCYYPYPSDTTHFYLRPLYIMLDSLFNEQWIIPFGVNDSIIGEAYHIIELNNSIFIGVGVRHLPGDLRNSLIMFFNIDGEELGFEQIYNDEITQGLSTNLIHDIARIDDSLFLASSYFRYGSEPGQWGEMIIDSAGNIYQYEMRSPSTSGWTKIVKTFDDKYTIGCGWDEGNTKTDIYLYKINEDLEHDTIYSGSYTYDSLCPYQIQSGNIDISDCLIITDVGEIPSYQEYYTSLQTILIKAYPNPVKENQITFEFQNTEHHKNMELKVFNVFGEMVHKEKVYQYQGESKVNIQNWQKGIYFAIVYSNGNIAGKTKFIVQ